MTRKLTYLFVSVFLFLHGCSFFLGPQQDSSVYASDPLQVTPATDLDASIELTTVDVNHMGFKVRIDGWRENMIVQNVWLQDASGNRIELETVFLTVDLEGSRFVSQYDLMPASLLPAGRFIGQIILQVGESPDGAPLHVLKFDLDVKLNPTIHVDVHQAVKANGVQILLESAEISPSSTTLLVCYDKPTMDDWLPGESSAIHIGERTALREDFTLWFDTQSGYTGATEEADWVAPITSGRCGTMRFPIERGEHTEVITFTIDELEPSTGFIPPGEDLGRAKEELSKKGIEIEIMTISELDGTGSSWNILQKPDEMDYAEAIRHIRSALEYYFRGPWVFSIQVKP